MNAAIPAPSTSVPREARARLVLGLLAVALAVTSVVAVGVGSVAISPGQALSILLEKVGAPGITPYEEQQALVLLFIRMPRVLLGVLVGGALAVSGAMMQGLFRNPLAEPGLVGVRPSL